VAEKVRFTTCFEGAGLLSSRYFCHSEHADTLAREFHVGAGALTRPDEHSSAIPTINFCWMSSSLKVSSIRVAQRRGICSWCELSFRGGFGRRGSCIFGLFQLPLVQPSCFQGGTDGTPISDLTSCQADTFSQSRQR